MAFGNLVLTARAIAGSRSATIHVGSSPFGNRAKARSQASVSLLPSRTTRMAKPGFWLASAITMTSPFRSPPERLRTSPVIGSPPTPASSGVWSRSLGRAASRPPRRPRSLEGRRHRPTRQPASPNDCRVPRAEQPAVGCGSRSRPTSWFGPCPCRCLAAATVGFGTSAGTPVSDAKHRCEFPGPPRCTSRRDRAARAPVPARKQRERVLARDELTAAVGMLLTAVRARAFMVGLAADASRGRKARLMRCLPPEWTHRKAKPS